MAVYLIEDKSFSDEYENESKSIKVSEAKAKSPRRVLIAKTIRKKSGNYGFDYSEYIYAYPSKSGKGFTCIVATDVGNYMLCNCKELTPEKVEAAYRKRYDPDYKSDFVWYQDNVDRLNKGEDEEYESLKEATESYSDGMLSIDQLREAISNLEELVSEMEINDISSVKASPNTYGLGNFFLGTSSGYINLNDVYRYLPDDEDEDN